VSVRGEALEGLSDDDLRELLAEFVAWRGRLGELVQFAPTPFTDSVIQALEGEFERRGLAKQ
jgi:hypothetical protein